jgi:hypothetical protein
VDISRRNLSKRRLIFASEQVLFEWNNIHCVFGDEGPEAVREDGFRATEEQGSGKRLAKHGERHRDGDLNRGWVVLNGEVRLRRGVGGGGWMVSK